MRRSPRRGFDTIASHVVADTAARVEFLRSLFGATGEFQFDRPAEIRISDSLVMTTASGDRPTAPAFLYVYVDGADATYARSLGAGATSPEVGAPVCIDWQLPSPSSTDRCRRQLAPARNRPFKIARGSIVTGTGLPSDVFLKPAMIPGEIAWRWNHG